MKKENQCRNSMIEDYEDLPRPKVKRHDGLPTVDDLKSMLKSKEEKPEKASGKNVAIHINLKKEGGGLESFIEKILSSF